MMPQCNRMLKYNIMGIQLLNFSSCPHLLAGQAVNEAMLPGEDATAPVCASYTVHTK
jgi:hypothetical protein